MAFPNESLSPHPTRDTGSRWQNASNQSNEAVQAFAHPWPQYRRGQRYIEELIEPQGLRVWSERPCKHPSCFWAKASKPMIIKAARTSPGTRFFITTTTPRDWRTT